MFASVGQANLARDEASCLDWRSEVACRQAWPAGSETIVDDWLVRRSGGTIRRTNSANPLSASPSNSAATIERIEAIYAGHRQTPMFRVPTIANEIDAELDRRGYQVEGGTIHLLCDLEKVAGLSGDGVSLALEPDENWLEAKFRMASSDSVDRSVFRQMVGLICGRKAFAAALDGAMIVSVAYGVIIDGLFVIESVVTDAGYRQRGLGRRTVGALLGWARSSGAETSCLQVVAENAPARALYASLGFDRELYRYHYRRRLQPT